MARTKEIDRDRILDAAGAVIMGSDGRQFTLDAVAATAGISKGGLVYSFATKDALITAVVERELERFQFEVDRRTQAEPSRACNKLLAYAEEALDGSEGLARKAAFLMTALMHAPDIVSPCRSFYRTLFHLFDAETTQGRDIRQAILAVEGIFLLRGLGFADVCAEEWDSVLRHARDTIAALADVGGRHDQAPGGR